MICNLTPTNKQALIERLSQLARDKFASRAAGYDRTASFPTENFEDLFNAGFHAPAVPTEYGGLGLGHNSDIFTLWMMTKELAKVDLSLARCWEGHANAQVILAAMGNESQKKRWFEGIVQHGEKLRDLSFYVLHDNCDRVLSSIGQEILGQSFDRAYFNTHPTHP